MLKANRIGWGLVLICLLAACSPGAAPQLIGAYPRSGVPAPPADGRVVYTGYLTLEVGDVDAAVTQAAAYAEAYGGYLAESRAWFEGEQKVAVVTLAVPAPNFEALRQAVLGLGRLVTETLAGQPRPINGDAWGAYTQIQVTLRPAPAAFTLPALLVAGWAPGRTLARALGVSVTVFGFLADIVIWLVVVGGPFVVLGWGARALWRRSRARRP